MFNLMIQSHWHRPAFYSTSL